MRDGRWDVDTSGGGGGPWAGIRRALGNADNPMTWGFPLYRLAGIRVRMHLFFVVYVIAELLRAAGKGDVAFTALILGTLFVVVLLHEYGHCIACRWVGGDADEILLWPLGGLAWCRPPHDWKSDLVTTVGGPAVNVLLAPILGAAVFAFVGNWHAIVFNPFDPYAQGWQWVAGASYFVRLLWTAHYVNLLLLAFNVLLPMYPMDGGRMVQAILWRKLGFRRSMEISTLTGLVAAVCLAIAGVVGEQTLLLGIALFGGLTCWVQRQRLKMGMDADDAFVERVHRGPGKAELRRRAKEQEHFRHVEQILDKISRQGMSSLTRAERRTLETETRRKRGR